jgi:hypothetical protein
VYKGFLDRSRLHEIEMPGDRVETVLNDLVRAVRLSVRPART